MELGLQETAFFDPKREAWGFGTHIALVSIDRDTGKLTIEKLVLVDDCGVVINPMIVEGQIHGGVAQGLGEALREQMLYRRRRPGAHRHVDELRGPARRPTCRR